MLRRCWLVVVVGVVVVLSNGPATRARWAVLVSSSLRIVSQVNGRSLRQVAFAICIQRVRPSVRMSSGRASQSARSPAGRRGSDWPARQPLVRVCFIEYIAPPQKSSRLINQSLRAGEIDTLLMTTTQQWLADLARGCRALPVTRFGGRKGRTTRKSPHGIRRAASFGSANVVGRHRLH